MTITQRSKSRNKQQCRKITKIKLLDQWEWPKKEWSQKRDQWSSPHITAEGRGARESCDVHSGWYTSGSAMENRLSTVSACTSLQLGGLNIAYKQTTSLKIAKPFYLLNCDTHETPLHNENKQKYEWTGSLVIPTHCLWHRDQQGSTKLAS